MAHYLFNLAGGDEASLRERSAALLRVRMWGVDSGERHRDSLAAGDLALIYLGAPGRIFVARAELASAARDWTPAEARDYPGDDTGGVLLGRVEEWDPPVPMSAVLPRVDPAGGARADFDTGVVRITADEYETALAVAVERAAPAG